MSARRRRYILAIDIGGTSVKLCVSNRRIVEQFDASPAMTPREMLRYIRPIVKHWNYHLVTVGYPGLVIDGRIVVEPANLGSGWVGFDFAKAFNRPTRIVNDAVMQALGSYAGGRMLFLGFGTALGAVAILDNRIYPMELAHLPFTKRGLIQNYVGDEALRRLGRKQWSTNAKKVMRHMSHILDVHYLVVGGGNARRLGRLPRWASLGGNKLAFTGGFRAWQRSAGAQI